MDGKHAVLQAPVSSGINLYNYKSTFGIVLFAFVNAIYNFLFVDVCCQGRILDGDVFRNYELRENGEGFFMFSTTNSFDRKKEASSLFLFC
jgi:hypothetical protein